MFSLFCFRDALRVRLVGYRVWVCVYVVRCCLSFVAVSVVAVLVLVGAVSFVMLLSVMLVFVAFLFAPSEFASLRTLPWRDGCRMRRIS